jgi:hypothetical protein
MTMAEVSADRHVLDVALSQPISGVPFATIRSMYITDFNNDVARVAVRDAGANGWREEPVMAFRNGTVTDLWAGRTSVSRHNSSSPDMVFSKFSGKPSGK